MIPTNPLPVDPQNSEMENSPITSGVVKAAAVWTPRGCFWNGHQYPPGTAVSCEGKKYVCVCDDDGCYWWGPT